ncbi:MAG: hypothetical protein KUG81_10400 [Gammaproteobacteria bacterium]|nr:hypothetical protein [Gammaproteobacteria bacterium]
MIWKNCLGTTAVTRLDQVMVTRFGLLALVASNACIELLEVLPASVQFDAWYGGAAAFLRLALLTVYLAALWIVRAGRKSPKVQDSVLP